MADTIHLQHIHCTTIVGVLPGERHSRQKLELSASLQVRSLAEVGKSGDLSKGIDYKSLLDFITWYCATWHFGLLESLAEGLAFAILKHYPHSTGITLSIEKPQALQGAAIPSIQIQRTPDDYDTDHIDITLYGTERLLISLQPLPLATAPESSRQLWPVSTDFALQFAIYVA